MFVCRDSSDFDLGPDVLDNMASAAWPHPSPQANKLVGMAWVATRQCQGDLAALGKCWLSLLASTGTLLTNSATDFKGIVAGTCQFGVLCLPVKYVKKSGVVWVQPTSLKSPLTACITALDGWKACTLNLRTAAQIYKDAGQIAVAGMAWRLSDSVTTSLGACAAKTGFKFMSKFFLDKLLQHCGVTFGRGKSPKTVPELVRHLILHFVPDATADFIDAALAHRSAPRKIEKQLAMQSVLAEGTNLAAMQQCVDEGELQEVEKVVAKCKSLKGRAAAASSGTAASSSSQKKEWARKVADPNVEYTVPAARIFLPDVRGCVLSIDEVRFTRWSGSYPKPLPPFVCTKSFGVRTGLTNTQALFIVLRQLWAWHTDETGQPCPWTFAD